MQCAALDFHESLTLEESASPPPLARLGVDGDGQTRRTGLLRPPSESGHQCFADAVSGGECSDDRDMPGSRLAAEKPDEYPGLMSNQADPAVVRGRCPAGGVKSTVLQAIAIEFFKQAPARIVGNQRA